MSKEEELEFWHKRTEKMRARQETSKSKAEQTFAA